MLISPRLIVHKNKIRLLGVQKGGCRYSQVGYSADKAAHIKVFISLSGRMFTFMMRWMAGEVVNRGEGHSDPGTITREEFVDSTVIVVNDSTELKKQK